MVDLIPPKMNRHSDRPHGAYGESGCWSLQRKPRAGCQMTWLGYVWTNGHGSDRLHRCQIVLHIREGAEKYYTEKVLRHAPLDMHALGPPDYYASIRDRISCSAKATGYVTFGCLITILSQFYRRGIIVHYWARFCLGSRRRNILLRYCWSLNGPLVKSRLYANVVCYSRCCGRSIDYRRLGVPCRAFELVIIPCESRAGYGFLRIRGGLTTVRCARGWRACHHQPANVCRKTSTSHWHVWLCGYNPWLRILIRGVRTELAV